MFDSSDKGSWTSFNKEDQTEKENKLDGKTDGGVDDKTDGEMDDVWMMTDEQRLYYVKQFQSMQSDLTKTLSGYFFCIVFYIIIIIFIVFFIFKSFEYYNKWFQDR